MVTRQGSAMGYSVASLSGIPIRYVPADSSLMYLSSITVTIETCESEFERIIPARETEWSHSIRQRGIQSLVSNPNAVRFYQQPSILFYSERTAPLNVLDSPSLEGDGVDMLIITSGPNGPGPDLTDAFQELADYRTSQGIITIIRTVDWIDTYYSGCDIQEKIRFFIRDAHENWGVQAVLLGGDDWVVPCREVWGGIFSPQEYCPSDDYYSDIDGDWSLDVTGWEVPDDDWYVDLTVGRWPVDNENDVELMLEKEKLYECPSEFPEDYARCALFIGGSSSGTNGLGAVYEEYLNYLLVDEGIAGTGGSNLDSIDELYYPGRGYDYCEPYGGDYYFESQNELSRQSAINEINSGYNIIIHMDHSGTHKIGSAQQAGQHVYEYDFETLLNNFMPSILWTGGCWPGHYQGAECFIEAGLLTSSTSGLVAAIANPRSGAWGDWKLYYPFMDALYQFGWIDDSPSGPPYPISSQSSTIGEAYRYSMNFENNIWGYNDNKNYHRSMQHLFGDPSLFVWRDNPHQLGVETDPTSISIGSSCDIDVTVTDADNNDQPVAARVCLFKDGDLYAVSYTDMVYGTVTFNNVEVAHSGEITVTATKRRADIGQNPGVVNFLPGVATISVGGASGAVVTLEDFVIDDDDSGSSEGNSDATANPGETIELDLDVKNTGRSTATNITAQLTIISGDITIDDGYVSIGSLAGSASTQVQNAFVISIPSYLTENEAVQLEVEFDYDQGSWTSPCDFTIHVDSIVLPLHSIDVVYNSQDDFTTIEVSNILAVSSETGYAEDVEILLDDFNFGANFSSDVSVVGDIVPGTAVEAPSIKAVCLDPPQEWTSSPFNGCSFRIVAEDRWDREIFEEYITVAEFCTNDTPDTPPQASFEAVEAGQDYINVEWDGPSGFDGTFYLYCKEHNDPAWIRSNLLPIPVEQYTYPNLESMTQYDLAVSAIDDYGQESPLCEMEDPISTVCTYIPGWPVQIEGDPGTGPLVTDVDGDDDLEVIVATDRGHLYIIENDGDLELIDDNDEYAFTGCSVGDVFSGGYLEIVVSGSSFDLEHGAVFVYKWNAQTQEWDCTELEADSAPSNTGEALHPYFSVPVLLQSEVGSKTTLEIALRTFNGSFSGTQAGWLYLWEYTNGDWDQVSGYPVTLSGAEWDYAPPVVTNDIDGDGIAELIVSSGTEKLLCVETDNGISLVAWDLEDLPESDYWNLGQSTYEFIECSGANLIVGTARHDLGYSTHDRSDNVVYCWSCDDEEIQWVTPSESPFIQARDAFGNNGGLAIGDIDGDTYLDVVKQFANDDISPVYGDEFVGVWDITSGSEVVSTSIYKNNHQEDYAIAPVAVGGSLGDGMAISFGYSTCGYSMYLDDDELCNSLGYPYWTEELVFASPVIADIDNDNYLEVLYSDASGLMAFVDWDVVSSSDGWLMYQHDTQRSGNYIVSVATASTLDFQVISILEQVNEDQDGVNRVYEITVRISGVGIQHLQEEVNNIAISNLDRLGTSNTEAHISSTTGHTELNQNRRVGDTSCILDNDLVDIAILNGSEIVSLVSIPVMDGEHCIRLPIVAGSSTCNDDISVYIDPSDEYPEYMENNNYGSLLGTYSRHSLDAFLPSPSNNITVQLSLPTPLESTLTIRAYSIAGRLVAEQTTSNLGVGIHSIPISESGELPSGLYTVVISGIGDEELVRRTIITH